jgi:predicted nucleic acid-binding Zn ribbon protein
MENQVKYVKFGLSNNISTKDAINVLDNMIRNNSDNILKYKKREKKKSKIFYFLIIFSPIILFYLGYSSQNIFIFLFILAIIESFK